jgi:hypothetical protein
MLATTIHWSIFGSKSADRIMREDGDWTMLLERITNSGPHKSKATCPWVKMARFGDHRSEGNSLRCDENVQEVYGVEGDYDEEVMQPEEAISKLESAHIKAVVYTSPSHTPEKPRWRVLAPLSQPHNPQERYALLARINGVLGGVFSDESFVLSQSYFFGRVAGAPEYKVLVTFDDPEEGHCIDQLTELDQIAIGRKVQQQKTSGASISSTPDNPKWGESELATKVAMLGRKLRTGDGRHFAMVRAANSLSAQGVRNAATVALMLEALAQKYFDPADPPAHNALAEIAKHAVDRDDRKQSEAAALVDGLLQNYRHKIEKVNPETGEITHPTSSEDDLPSIDDVQVWCEDAQLAVPTHLKNVPHPTLSRVVAAILSSAETTDMALSVSGAIHLACCTVARKVRSNKANSAVLFLGNVARTGRGKNAAKNFVSKAMVRAFGVSPTSDFTSSSSLFTLLHNQPAAILHLDEFGDKLRHGLKDANGSPIVKGFSALKEIYSQADDILSPAAFSMIAMTSRQRKEFASTNAPIQLPHLNILAVTTPGQLADAITDASVEGGLINRFLFVTASGEVVENDDFDPVPPDWLIEYMQEVAAELVPKTGGNADNIQPESATLVPNITEFAFCKTSMNYLNAFKQEIKDLGKTDEFMADMSQRWRENAMRMALAIHAFCEPHHLTIEPNITQWCIDYCRYYGKRFAFKTLELAQPSEKYGQRRKAYLQAFREHPEGMTSDKMGKMAPWRNDAPSFRNALIGDMLASGEIARVMGKKPSRGPAPKVWVALQC